MKELLDKQIALEEEESRLYKRYQVESANIRNDIMLVKKVYLQEMLEKMD